MKTTLNNCFSLIQGFTPRWTNLPLRIKLAYVGLAVGLTGMFVCLVRFPELDAPVDVVSTWAAADMLFTIIALSSFVGTVSDRINSYHLKIIDLVWVCASAVGVVFAIVQVFVSEEDRSRKHLEQQWAISRSTAIQLLSLAEREECAGQSIGSAKGCQQLAVLNTVLSSHGIIEKSRLKEACPTFPIDLSRSTPAGYSHARAQGCINAAFVSNVLQEPVMLDKENAEAWRSNTRLWPLLLMFFIALRVSKSAAEVIWKIK
jgi:hypothetical protein